MKLNCKNSASKHSNNTHKYHSEHDREMFENLTLRRGEHALKLEIF